MTTLAYLKEEITKTLLIGLADETIDENLEIGYGRSSACTVGSAFGIGRCLNERN